MIGGLVLAADIDDRYAGDYRDLSPWTRALTAVSLLCLVLHAGRAGLMTFAAASAGETWLNSSVETPVDLALKGLFLASAGVGLAWLYRASANAHALSPGMKHSPRAAVGWFFVPALNFLFSLSVVYEIWTRSGGPERAKILITWWSFTVLSIYGGSVWILGFEAPLFIQGVFAGSTLSFLILARRIDGFQRLAAMAAEFGEAPEQDHVVPEDPAFRPPPTTVETVDPPRFVEAGNSSLHLSRRTPTLSGPGVILVSRPSTPPLEPPADA